MDNDKTPINGTDMYEDVTDEELREEWEDTIQSFVPAFAGVEVKTIGDRSLDAHLVIEPDGELAVRIMDANETVTFTFPLKDIFTFDVTQFSEESWEMYFGLIETQRQLAYIKCIFDGLCEQAAGIMKLRDDQPPTN